MKRVICLLLAALFCGTLLAACGGEETSSEGSAGTQTSVSDKTSDQKASDKSVALYDPDMEHKIIVTDIQNEALFVLDLNLANDWSELTDPQLVIWEWKASEHTASCVPSLDEAKFRYSDYYKKDVIIATSSGGWVGVIDYETKNVLWEERFSKSPHSVEMLPNGDLAVAQSAGATANGELSYVPLSAGRKSISGRLKVASCHGVCWDPEKEFLWVLGDDGVIGVAVDGYGTRNAKPVVIDGVGAKFGGNQLGGHDLSPVFGTENKYWVTSHSGVWVFDANENTMNKRYSCQGAISASSVKGIAHFADNTMVQTVAPGDTKDSTNDWSTRKLRVLTMGMSSGKVSEPEVTASVVRFDEREFYKVHTFTKDYH